MPGEPGPETDDSQNPTSAAPGDDARQPFRDMLSQLQGMIDTVAVKSGPVLREVAAKAAELAAVAGERAGPIAYKAAEATQKLGQKVADTSKEVAADLRRQPGGREWQRIRGHVRRTAPAPTTRTARRTTGPAPNQTPAYKPKPGRFRDRVLRYLGDRLAAVLLGLRFLAALTIARLALDLGVTRVGDVPARAVVGLEHVPFGVLAARSDLPLRGSCCPRAPADLRWLLTCSFSSPFSATVGAWAGHALVAV